MHMPPPIHGASLMGLYIHNSEMINNSFDCRYINLMIAKSIEDVQKFGVKKLFRYIILLVNLIIQLLSFKPAIVYFTPNSCGKPFYKEFPIMLLLKLMGRRVVAHYHNSGVSNRSNRWIDNFLYRIFFIHTKVILLSERLYPEFAKYVIKENVHICPNGIPDTNVQFKRILDTKKVPVLLFLSNLLTEKGVWTLIDALAELHNRNVRFKCIIAGNESAEISEKQLEKVLINKKLSDVVSYYGPAYGDIKIKLFMSANIFVFPSYKECFPLVLLEAMQYGLPCITTNVGGIPDIVQSGINGLVCKTHDTNSLAKNIKYLLDNPKEGLKMGQMGRVLYKNNFTIEKFYIEFRKSLLWALE